ncbi:(2Fe-2S) ferredoxin domain-containing protein [Candidatus Marinimicrobia bacterium]|nr:(2Fe-2S) ferredoxin domain-containing protein [Candidatus Neomarinimicrobiota bacterium]
MKFEKHIFICTNERDENSLRKSCGSCGGLDLRKDLVRMINESGLKGRVRANKSGCLDVCEKGPAMVIYPNGFWYLDVKKKDIKTIFKKSIINNEPVSELIATNDQLNNR